MGLYEPKGTPRTPEWLRQWRPKVYEKMISLALSKREGTVLKKKRTELARYARKHLELGEDVRARCPHIIEKQDYKESLLEDTLGNMVGSRHQIQCSGCGKVLARWDER